MNYLTCANPFEGQYSFANTRVLWDAPVPTPVPTPTPPQGFGGGNNNNNGFNANQWNQNWNQSWNQGWNSGFNNPNASMNNSAPGWNTGYGVGQQAYQQRHQGGGGQVLGASTQNNNQPQGQQNPQAPDMSIFDQMINPVIASFEAQIGQQQGQTANNISGWQAQRGTELGQAQAQQQGQENTLNQQAANQTTQTGNAVEDAKRMFAEQQQGLSARFGNSTGTGQFFGEQLAQNTNTNVSRLQQGLQSTLQDINDKMSQVKQVGALAQQSINQRFDQQIQQEQDNLQKYITQIRGNETMLQSNKAQMAQQALQKYQDTVNNLNAQREQMANQYKIAELNAQTQLKTYAARGTALSQTQYSPAQTQSSNAGNFSSVAPTGTQADTGSVIAQVNQKNPFQTATA
jgi:hypothetical protein